jgi:hypothetical protein
LRRLGRVVAMAQPEFRACEAPNEVEADRGVGLSNSKLEEMNTEIRLINHKPNVAPDSSVQ